MSRDFARLWIASTISAFGTAAATVALPLVALTTLHASTFQVGVISAAGLLSWLLLGLSAGVLVERTTNRSLLIACDLVRAATLVSIPVMAMLDLLTITQTVIVALVVGAGSVFFDIASQKYLPSILESHELLAGNSRLQAGFAGATTAGPPAGGLLVHAVGAPVTLLLDAMSYVCSALLLSKVTHREAPVQRPERIRMLPRIREGLAYVAGDPIMRTLTILAATINLLGAALDTLMLPFLSRDIGLPAGVIGVVLAISGVGGIVGAAICSRLTRLTGAARMLLVASLVGPSAALLVPLSSPGWGLGLLAFGLLVREACVAVLSLITRSYRQATVPRELLARVIASIRFISWGVLPIGAFAAGLVGELIGNRGALWIVCGLMWLGLLVVYPLWTSRGRRLFDAMETEH